MSLEERVTKLEEIISSIIGLEKNNLDRIQSNIILASRIFGEGNVYICNCKESNVSHITAENEFILYDQFGVKWPATMSRIANREEPFVSANNVEIYGSDTSDNLIFENKDSSTVQQLHMENNIYY